MAIACFKNDKSVYIDGACLTENSRNLFDFTVHFTLLKERSILELPSVEIKNKTLLVVEGPEFATASKNTR